MPQKSIYEIWGTGPGIALLFVRLIDRLNNKADNDQDRYKDNECWDDIDYRMLLDEYRRKDNEKAENIAQKEEELSVLKREMNACGDCESIVNVEARQNVCRRVDRVQICNAVHEDIIAVWKLLAEL